MRFIGITGGVGAGKSAILSYLSEKPKTRVMLADEIAHDLMEPGTDCYRQIVERFAGEDIFGTHEGVEHVADEENRPFDRGKLAQIIFSDPVKRDAMNGIVHPAVKEYVRQDTSSAVNAENACTSTEQKHSIHRKTTSCAVATKLAQPIAPRIISVNVCLMKSCYEISVR